MAPEVVTGESYGKECDVYSFAIIMYEMLAEKLPYYDVPNQVNLQMRAAMSGTFRPTLTEDIRTRPPGILLTGGREAKLQVPEFVLETLDKYIELMKQCWVHNPSDRPSIDAVFERLQSLSEVLEKDWPSPTV